MLHAATAFFNEIITEAKFNDSQEGNSSIKIRNKITNYVTGESRIVKKSRKRGSLCGNTG